MHGRSGMIVPKLVAWVVIGGALLLLFVALLDPFPDNRYEMTCRAVCMSNLSYINKALAIYRGENNGAWPWIANVTSDWSAVTTGANRNRSPRKDPNAPGERSMTSLMFLLVRMNQSPGMFRCPSDKNSEVDRAVKADANDGDVLMGEYYWDFADAENLSFSWQAPRRRADRFLQGISKYETEMSVCADMTPLYEGDEKWIPISINDRTPQAEIEKQLSNNHNGKQIHLLTAAGYVQRQKRPDVGVDKDNIYTAFGSDFKNGRGATSLDIREHRWESDTFLIGPVGRSEAIDEP